ncbi:RNA methyltransferase [Psychroflexus sp. CAK57W]|uniref:TrmH family RNA methyltransferase n=1 Tax=Psychroflexus curvus TaxID=2873595 RepID=UPI001CCB49E0|nr:RNA methyltransferase [Psychroflexus curvus]MBZ9626566.1 RNA methyltransferase [Psychroflexus curvus]MBZ9786333.1 RNA methyltransferase [Psychroflexus curvus]
MLSKNQIKLINSLNKKKHRLEHGLFVTEGVKVIKEFLKSSFTLRALYSVADIFHIEEGESHIISEKELQKISNLKTPQTALAVFEIPKSHQSTGENGITLVLDGIRDPGNLGTIIRMCDWFGVEQLVCSQDTVDCFNPKVVQATMGSLTRVRMRYTDLNTYLSDSSSHIYGAYMTGTDVYTATLETKNAIIVLGNEANGISSSIQSHIDERISIPSYGKTQGAESLNVAMAGAILLSEFKRR